MTRSFCGSDHHRKFIAEIAIHSPGLKNINKPIVRVYPELLICPDCGKAGFAIPGTDLRVLTKDDAAAADVS